MYHGVCPGPGTLKYLVRENHQGPGSGVTAGDGDGNGLGLGDGDGDGLGLGVGDGLGFGLGVGVIAGEP